MGTPLKIDSLGAVAAAEEEGRWVTIKHPGTQEPLYLGGQETIPFQVRVAGPYSQTAKAEQKKNREASLKRRSRPDVDEVEHKEISVLAACTLEWRGAFDDEGAVIPLTKANAHAIYAAAPFIADQVDAEGGDHARFFGNK